MLCKTIANAALKYLTANVISKSIEQKSTAMCVRFVFTLLWFRAKRGNRW